MWRRTRPVERVDYSLIDVGEGRRLERFGAHVLDRPAPAALGRRRDGAAWRTADLRFDAVTGWVSDGAIVDPEEIGPWSIELDGLVLELRPTSSGGIGLYPEHRANLAWLEGQVRRRPQGDSPPSVLNLFAHTGLATLAAARAGAAVTHVDGAKTAVAWARRNASLSGLADRPIRWLVEDVMTLVAREAKRGKRYDGIVLDPPSFGHAKGRRWRLADELPHLILACRDATTDDAFVLLTAHTIGLDPGDLARLLRAAFPTPTQRIDGSALVLPAESGARLELGWSVRLGS